MTPVVSQTTAGIAVLLSAAAFALLALLSWMVRQASRRKSRARAASEAVARQAELHTVRAESAFQAMFEMAPAGLVLFDRQGAITGWNGAMAALIDIPPGHAMEAFLADEQIARAREHLSAEGELPAQDISLEDLSSRKLRLRGGRVTTGGGDFVHDWLALEDVTRIRLADARINDLERELTAVRGEAERQARELIDESLDVARSRDRSVRLAQLRVDMLASFATGIRQRIAPVANLAQVIRNQGSGPSELLDLIRGAARDVDAAVDEVIEYTRIETGQVELADVAFSVGALVESVADGLAEKAEANGVEMICHVEGGIPQAVAGDAARLRQVLQSLLARAVEHTHSGEVCLRAGVTGENATSCVLRFEVEDSGDGMEPAVLDKLFEPSPQAIAARGRAARNGRLDLPSCRQLVELMGGQIGVESAPGQGTRFWLAVKLKKRDRVEGKASAALGSDPNTPRVLANRRALVVDDLASARGVIAEMLERHGLRVATAANGHDAVQAVMEANSAGDPFALAILDYEMPGGTGLETAQTILDLPDGGQACLILAIPASLRHWRDEPVLDGVVAAISKPVQDSALVEALERCARIISAREPAESMQGLTEAVDAAEPVPAPDDPGKRLVLIAEDNLVNQRVARSLVEKMGYATVVVRDGREAVTAVANGHFDLILMDSQMPELDGLSATAEIRALEGDVRYIPIIAMTANAMRGDRERCLDAGMNDYVSKPVAYETLRSVLTYWLNRSEAPVS